MRRADPYAKEPGESRQRSANAGIDRSARMPWYISTLNLVGRVLRAGNVHLFRLGESLLGEFDGTVSHDSCWGSREELEAIRAALESFSRGIDDNPRLTSFARFVLKKSALANLRNRRRCIAFIESHADFIRQKGRIARPLVIAGMPRTGSTFLQRLVSLDPNTRSPLSYEFESPLPPIHAGEAPRADPRVTKSEESLAFMRRFAPGLIDSFEKVHEFAPLKPEESLTSMFEHHGLALLTALSAGDEYLDRILQEKTARGIFRYERQFLTMLDAYSPATSHWTLKSPLYALHFPLVFSEYPDANVIITHRAPTKSLLSLCNLLHIVAAFHERPGTVSKRRIGETAMGIVEPCMRLPMKFRYSDPSKERQIFDCDYDALVSDPILLIKNVYRAFNLEFTGEFETRMREYVKTDRSGKSGLAPHTLEEYGFSPEQVRDRFEDYEGFRNARISPGTRESEP